MSWKLHSTHRPKLKAPILIEGLPGIGNVGKVAMDFLIDELRAKKIGEFRGGTLPNSVFVTEDHLLKLPSIELFYKKGNPDILLLAGDAQPSGDKSCYEFCNAVLDVFAEFKGKDIVTLGGVALKVEPKLPKVYLTGNSQKVVEAYSKGTQAKTQIYGLVGPVIGVSGVLPGLAQQRNIRAASLLAETYGHPLHLGLRGAQEIVKILKKKLALPIDIELLEKEISEIESEISKQELNASHNAKVMRLKRGQDVNYIG